MMDAVDPRNCHVVLLAGGTSGEREISLASAAGAHEALLEAGFPVTMLDPARKEDIKKLVGGSFDVAFLCMHGKNGEDGTLQGLLEVLGIPYIGSGVWASALATDKAKAKIFYERFGIPTPPSAVVTSLADFDAERVLADMGGHCVVKPLVEGSSLGVFIVDSAQDLQRDVELELGKHGEVLVEKFVQGRELTVAVLGNEDPRALPVIEIVPQAEFYDFESKYAEGGSQHICPAQLTDSETKLVQDSAVRAHRALECAGVSRSDFILDDDGCCWILETNTIPGMTGTSLLPDAARVAGMSFAELCTELIGLAFEKQKPHTSPSFRL